MSIFLPWFCVSENAPEKELRRENEDNQDPGKCVILSEFMYTCELASTLLNHIKVGMI